MDANEKQVLITNELLKKIVKLRKRMENHPEHMPYKRDLVRILVDIEKILSSQPLDLDKLSKDKFGIFRMVTDSSSLERSAIGKELMSLLNELYLFLQTTKGEPTSID
ncbi:MAG: hypothetical protein IH588_02065 [Anaerolineales bacterium]|nr:hypothetical protein [Anaerolineales bacterium]